VRIAMVNWPYELRERRAGRVEWVTVPPQGYGGVQWIIANLIDGLLALGHEVYLLGAPGSRVRPRLHVVGEATTPEAMAAWLADAPVDVVHDHAEGFVDVAEVRPGLPALSTHHATGRPRGPRLAVYSSFAQLRAAGTAPGPVVRIPVNPARYRTRETKGDYLLFLGRVSPWKGAMEAAAFAAAAGLRCVIAGPARDVEYRDRIVRRFPAAELVGEVGGRERLRLLAGARAVLVPSQPVTGPWGDVWSEPGATVVSEAAASGTPVVSTDNGCLAEITPYVGRVVVEPMDRLTPAGARAILESLPSPAEARAAAIAHWGHLTIARQYVALYERAVSGHGW
jgi:glycosyltransferase involved in cell wall biosynthesis